MDGRLNRLHRERDQAQRRVDYCRRELSRFESYADPSRETDMVMLCKLQRDLRISERAAGYAALQLEDALDDEELNL